MHHPTRKLPTRAKNSTKRPGTESMTRVPKKVCFKKHCDLWKKLGGAYTMHNTKDCCKYEKDGSEKANFHATKKGRKKPTPAKQSFA
jgi:hypothetical protein